MRIAGECERRLRLALLQPVGRRGAGWRLLRRSLSNGCDEAIALTGDGIDEGRLFRVVPKDMADFADRTADAVVRIEEDTVSPDPGDDLLARDDLAGVFYEQQENLERYALQPQDM